jgi:nickel transport protein
MKSWILLLTIVVILSPARSYAHKVNIYAYAEDGMVFSEGYFADGSRCRSCLIEVFDEKTGEKLLEGKTDAQGQFSFKIPKVAPLKLILHAGTGHQNSYTLTEEELQGIDAPDVKTTVETETNLSEVEAAVERVLDRKLKPITRMLLQINEATQRPGITEVLGGIGYIIGLMGLALYFKRGRKPPSS